MMFSDLSNSIPAAPPEWIAHWVTTERDSRLLLLKNLTAAF